MKQKVIFTVQVFSTLILFVSIFVTYLEKGANTPYEIEKQQIQNYQEDQTGKKFNILNSPFTLNFSELLEG